MAFKVAARAVLELGAELISSDEIAIYELVKNAFDAKSPTVEVEFRVRMRRTEYEAFTAAFAEPQYEDENGVDRHPTSRERMDSQRDFEQARSAISELLHRRKLRRTASRLAKCESRSSARRYLRAAYRRLSTITIRDSGDGMSMQTLRGAFMTIGTPHRLRQRRQLVCPH